MGIDFDQTKLNEATLYCPTPPMATMMSWWEQRNDTSTEIVTARRDEAKI